MFDWNPVYLPFVGGVDTKIDEKLLPMGRLEVVENAVFTKHGTVKKRDGYNRIPPETATFAALSGTVRTLASFQNELLAFTDSRCYSLDRDNEVWIDRGDYFAPTFTQKEVITLDSEQTAGAVASTATMVAYAWEDTRGGIRASLYSKTTGTALVADYEVVASNATKPRLVAIGGNILLTYANTSTDAIDGVIIQGADPVGTIDDTPSQLFPDLATNHLYDVCEGGTGQAYVFYNTDNTVVTGVRAGKVDGGGNATAGSAAVYATNANSGVSCVLGPDTGHLFVTYNLGTSNYVGAVSTSTFTQTYAAFTNSKSNLTTCTIAARGGGIVDLWYTQSAGANENYTTDHKAWKFNVGASPSLHEGEVTLRHCYIATNGFTINSVGLCILGHDSRSGLQNSYYLYNNANQMVGQLIPGEGTGVPATPFLADARTTSDGKVELALPFQRQLDAKTDDIAIHRHKGFKRVEFDPDARPSVVEVGGGAYVSGSQVWQYDGNNLYEAGFMMWPDVLASDVSQDATNSGNIENEKAYNYRVYYETVSVTGERSRSLALSVTKTATSTQQFKITIPTLQFTQRNDTINSFVKVNIVVYRTEGNKGQLYYRVSGLDPATACTAGAPNGWIDNNLAADSVDFYDHMADSTLISQEIDYLSLSELGNTAPPAAAYLGKAQDRVFLAGGALPENTLNYSKKHVDGSPVEFADELQITDAPDEGGAIKGVSYISGAVIVFKERLVFGLRGEGPNNDGTGIPYASSLVSSDSGLEDDGVFAVLPKGLMFKGDKGFYVVDLSGTLQYVGGPAEDYNDQTFTAATVIPNTNSVYFLTASGTTLVYDYFFNQWGTFTNHEGKAAALLGGTTYCYLRNDDDVFIMDRGYYRDAAAPFAMKVRTGPIRPVGIQGYFKLARFAVLGTYKSAHTLKTSLYYNREEAPFETYTWDPSTVISTDVWGDDAGVWGDSTVWGGERGGNEYQHEHRPKRTKAQAIRIEFQDIPGADTGASYELTELALMIGTFKGLARLPATRKY